MIDLDIAADDSTVNNYVFDTDALAVSFACVRRGETYEISQYAQLHYKQGKTSPHRSTASEIVTPDELEQADRCRRHFKYKMTKIGLKGDLSKFRVKLMEYLQFKDVTVLPQDFIGLVCRLPEMYEEDMMFDYVKSITEREITNDPGGYDVDELTFIGEVKIRRRATNSSFVAMRNWFKNKKNEAVYLDIDPMSSFRVYFDQVKKGGILIDRSSFVSEEDGHQLFACSTNSWNFLGPLK